MANEKAATKPSAPKAQKKSVVKYFKDARSEFKKVVWPSRKQVINNTIVVIVVSIIAAVVIFGLDTAFGFIVRLIYKA